MEYPGGVLAVDAEGRNRFIPVDQSRLGTLGRFVRWRSDGSNIEIMDGRGQLIAKAAQVFGSPIITNFGFAVLSRSMQDVRWYSLNGEFQWKVMIESPLIGVEANQSGQVFLGTLQGTILVINSVGDIINTWQVPWSKIEVALGMSRIDNSHIALVFGQSPQNLTLLSWGAGRLRSEWSLPLQSDYDTDVLLQAIDQGKIILVEQPRELWLVSVEGKVLHVIPALGQVRKIVDVPHLDSFIVLRDALEGTYLELWTNQGLRAASYGPSTELYDCALAGKTTLVVSGAEGLVGFRLGVE
jgi:hypothetical protein